MSSAFLCVLQVAGFNEIGRPVLPILNRIAQLRTCLKSLQSTSRNYSIPAVTILPRRTSTTGRVAREDLPQKTSCLTESTPHLVLPDLKTCFAAHRARVEVTINVHATIPIPALLRLQPTGSCSPSLGRRTLIRWAIHKLLDNPIHKPFPTHVSHRL